MDGSTIEKVMPTGMFPTEPYFIPSPNAAGEDDGIVLVSGIDGEKRKGFLRVYNASSMELVTHATAPKLTLFGIHSRFYPFDVGCEQDDCTPEDFSSTTEQQFSSTTVTESTTPEDFSSTTEPQFSSTIVTESTTPEDFSPTTEPPFSSTTVTEITTVSSAILTVPSFLLLAPFALMLSRFTL